MRPRTPLVKVCGVTDAAPARAAVEAGADFLGLVFAPSPRRVTPARAQGLVDEVPAAWVGVFVDPDPDDVEDLVARVGLAAVQLHGAETPALCRAVRAATGRPVWKAIRWGGDATALEPWAGAADCLLLDSGAGGGRTLEWRSLARRLPLERRPAPLFLAGGLHAGNVAEAIAVVAPDGVDASSRLERAPGVKDLRRVRAFVEAARRATSAPVSPR